MGLAVSSVIGGIVFFLLIELISGSASIFGYLIMVACGAAIGGFLYDRVLKKNFKG